MTLDFHNTTTILIQLLRQSELCRRDHFMKEMLWNALRGRRNCNLLYRKINSLEWMFSLQFSGAYSDSCKAPDLIPLAQDDDNNMIPRIVLEIGTSESYNHLKQSAKIWLEGEPGVRECILVKIYENPPYHSPSIDNKDFPGPLSDPRKNFQK